MVTPLESYPVRKELRLNLQSLILRVHSAFSFILDVWYILYSTPTQFAVWISAECFFQNL